MLVFTIPVCLRKIFSRDHARLGDLSRIAYCAIRDFLGEHFPTVRGYPHVVLAIQTFADLLNAHAHLHAITSLGVSERDGTFHPAPEDLDFSALEEVFRHRVLRFLKDQSLISDSCYPKISRWHLSGFSVNSSVRIAAGDREGLERIAAYLLRPPISLQPLDCDPEGQTVVYRGKFHPRIGRNFEILEAEELIARLLVLLPEPYELRIRYYGAVSTTWRRKGKSEDETQPRAEEDDADSPQTFQEVSRKHWARMVQRVYHSDPLLCKRCGGRMKAIAFIDAPDIVERIRRHLALWNPARGPPPGEQSEGGYRVEYDPEYNPALEGNLTEA